MGIRFRKSKKIAPGLRLNFSKKGVGLRLGSRHAGISLGPGGVRSSASIPGTGISYSKKLSGGKRKKSASPQSNRQRAGLYKPVPLRAWYIVITVILLLGGIGCLFTNFSAAIFAIILGGGMAACTVLEIRKNNSIKMNERAEPEQ